MLTSRRLYGLIGAALLLSVVALTPRVDAEARAKRCGSSAPYGQEVDRPGQPDPLLPRQWGLDQIDAHEAWHLGATGEDVTIALIDTGVDLTHPDLDDNIVPGIDLLPERGVCPGPQDEHDPEQGLLTHGTTVAGVLAAEARNGMGVRGVAYDADILPIRSTTGTAFPFYPVDPSEPERLIAAIEHAVERAAEVILIEVAIAAIDDPDLERRVGQAIERAWNAGAVLVAPSVNASAPSCFYPASDEHVLCAAATDHEGAPASYSSLPNSHRALNAVRAPGGFDDPMAMFFREQAGASDVECQDHNVWTTILPVDPTWGCDLGAYDALSGTSYAAPLVAGVAAMLAQSGATNDEIVRCITSTALNPVTGLRGTYEPTYGYGILDADDAVRACR
ncbi:MAG: S8 family serine peptidase [Actinomycetota bacterium]